MSRVLLVDDHIGDISWLVDLLEARGYVIDQVTNEEAARSVLEGAKERLDEGGATDYELAVIDIMVSIKDIMDLVDLDDNFYEQSKDTGVRLCRYARDELGISQEDLPIVCISARADQDEFKPQLDQLGIPLFSRTPQSPEESIRNYVEGNLPRIE